MKMNKKSMIIGSLVAAVLITGNSVSGTYAKYTSQLDASDTARVAKWKVAFDSDAGKQTKTFELFGKKYKGSTDNVVYVESQNTDKVIAPGTTNDADLDVYVNSETMYALSLDKLGSTNDPFVVFYDRNAANGKAAYESAKTITEVEPKTTELATYFPLVYTLSMTIDNNSLLTQLTPGTTTFSGLIGGATATVAAGTGSNVVITLAGVNGYNIVDNANAILSQLNFKPTKEVGNTIKINVAWEWKDNNGIKLASTGNEDVTDYLDTFAGEHLSATAASLKIGLIVTQVTDTEGSSIIAE